MKELVFKDGRKVRIEFGEKEHTYNVSHPLMDGTWTSPVPTHGVTTPLSKTVDKPFIAPWVAKLSVHEVLAWCYNNQDKIAEIPKMFEDLELMESKVLGEDGRPLMTYYKFSKQYPWLSKLKSTYRTSSGEGKDAGTWFHGAVEKFLTTGEKPIVGEDTEGMWKSFIEWYNFNKPVLDEAEFVVYSPTYSYSGMGDFRGTVGGRKVIIDWKTTNRSDANKDGISFDNFYQLGGLAQAEFERTGEWPDDVGIVNVDKNGMEAVTIWGSDWGMTPEECAKRYISHLVAYKQQVNDGYKFDRRGR